MSREDRNWPGQNVAHFTLARAHFLISRLLVVDDLWSGRGGHGGRDRYEWNRISHISRGSVYLLAAPTVTAVAPTSGPAGGGTAITITGTNFVAGSTVTVGGTAATGVAFLNATTITANTPAHAAGIADVVVTTPGGSSAISAADNFTYIAAPRVSALSPTNGPVGGTTVVTITGTNFTGVTGVNFGATAATGVTFVNATTVTAVAPAHVAGVVDVVVTTPGGTSAISAADNYAYIAIPTVTGVSPVNGPLAGGTSVVITGTSFTGTTGAAGVKFGLVNATSYVVNSNTQITAMAPAGAAGPVNVTVTNPIGTSLVSAPADQFTYLAAPTVTAVSPLTGSTLGGTSITITGTSFGAGATVTVGATAATGVVVVNSTTITATTPAHAAGIVDVVVTTSGGTSPTSAADGFTYVVAAAPTVTAVSPNTGPTTGGTSITITGTGFTGATGVTVGGAAATGVVVNSATSITAITPAGVVGPAVDVRVTTPGGTSAISAADKFTYVAPAGPAVTAVSPNSGPIAGNTAITITGTGFTGATAVTVGGTAATSVVVVNDTTITANTPSHVVGTFDVIVTTPVGVSPVTAADQFTYVFVPTVTGISPTTGSVLGGTTITITGTSFTGATAVMVGAVAATNVVVVNSTTITATTPAHALGTVDATVTTPGGTSPTALSDKFTYIAAAAPTVTAVNPNSGPVSGATSITITGTGFTGATAVTVGGVAATSVVVVNATTITANTPAGSGVVDVLVTTPGGSSATSAADQFTYVGVPAPTVTVVNPSSGPVAGGTSITITGTNFTGATAVDFGAVAATSFTVNSATQITAIAPAGAAGSVDVTVTTPSGTSATSATDKFTYDSTQPTVTISAPSPAITSTGPVTYTITYGDANFGASTLTAADITLNKNGTANGVVSVDAGTGSTRTVTISGITGTGTLGISLAAGTAHDAAGNQAPAAGPSITVAVSNVASFAIGNTGGTVRMLNATGTVLATVRPLDSGATQYVGLVEVALRDFNGDGVADLAVAAADPSGVNGLAASKAGKVFIYDGATLATGTLALIDTFTPFANHFGPGTDRPIDLSGPYTNGLNIALGDVNGDGQVDLIAGTRGGNGTTSGQQEFGRLVVIDGTSPIGFNIVIGEIQYPFGVPANGNGYQKGVVVAAGNADGLGGDEIAVTRGGPVNSPNPAVQQIKVKVLQLQSGALRELPLAANGATAFAPFASLTGPANAINRDGRVAFVDTDGNGKAELVFSALDPLTSAFTEKVRVGVYSINVTASAGAAMIVSGGPDKGTYQAGSDVIDHAIIHVAGAGTSQNLALLTEGAFSSGLAYLAPLTGVVQPGGFSLNVLDGGITIDGI